MRAVGDWPLVGRDEELRFVLDTVRSGTARGVVVAGGLGVGKTRLAREALSALEPDFAAEWVAATPGATQIPFGAVSHLLDEEVSAPDDRLRVARGVAVKLAERAAGRPLILAVDDAQWLDPGTAALVHQLVASGRTHALLTVRTDEPEPEPIVACWKDGWTERLEVQPLQSVEVDELVRSVVGRPVDHRTLTRMWSLSEGNPLFVHELVRGAMESGAYEVTDGVWQWTQPGGASERLRSILELRIARVSEPGRRVLDALAVGEPLAVHLLDDLYGAEAVVEAERSGLSTVDRHTQQVRLCHPLYAEVLRAALGPLERRRIMARLADSIDVVVTVTSPADRLRVAVWRLDGGAPVSAGVLTEAAQIANSMYDHVLAERLARAALDAGARLDAAMVLGDALNRQGRCVEGLAVLDPLATQARTDAEHVGVAIARYFGLTTEFGFRAEFAEVLLAAENQVRSPKLLAFLRAQRATLLSSAGRLDEGVALATQTISEHPDEATELRAVSPLVSAWLAAGEADAACALTERMLEPAIRLRPELPQAPGWVMSLHVPGLLIAGRLDDADAATDLFEQAIAASGGGTAESSGLLALARGMSSLQRGQVRTAVGWLRQCIALMRPIARWRLPFALVQLAEAAALAGDGDGATAASEEADELVAHHAVFEGAARVARGWAALGRGEHSRALDLWIDGANWASEHGQHTAALLGLHHAARMGAARSVVEHLASTAGVCEGRWAPRFAAHARALVADDGDALQDAAAGFEEIGAILMAAEATAQASGSFANSGRRARAERAASRAVQLAARCEGACSPVLEELRRPLPLTRREREVAALAAGGLSSQAIADRLFVSVRTVEGHLQNAFGKLGVNDRASLAHVLGKDGGGG